MRAKMPIVYANIIFLYVDIKIMFDRTSPKVLAPAFLFAALSPGVLLQLPDTNNLATGATSRQAVLFHAMVFIIVYKIIAKCMGLNLKQTDLVVPAILFILLSPGMFLQLPDSTGLMTGRTSIQSVLVHTLVFALVFAFLRARFPQFY